MTSNEDRDAATTELRTVTSDGVEIAVVHLGGTGDPVLFAHATGFCATVWRPVVRELEALGGIGSCWAIDARGHGHSTRPSDGNFHWDGTATDVLAAIDAVEARSGTASDGSAAAGTPRWRGVGHSMGGAALLLAEARRPATFGSLWLYEPIVFPPSEISNEGGAALAAGAARRRSGFESAGAARANYASKPPMASFDPAALDGYLERGLVTDEDGPGVRLSCRPEDESQTYLMGGRHSAWHDLADIACPTIIACGSTAVDGPAAFATGIAGRLHDGTLEEHVTLGHFGPMEAPAELAASIAAALGRRR